MSSTYKIPFVHSDFMNDIKYYCNKKESGLNADYVCMLTGNPCYVRESNETCRTCTIPLLFPDKARELATRE